MPEEGRVEAFEFPQFKAWFCEDVVAEWRGWFSLQRLLGHKTSSMTSRYVTLWGSDLQKLHAKYSPVDKLKGQVNEEVALVGYGRVSWKGWLTRSR